MKHEALLNRTMELKEIVNQTAESFSQITINHDFSSLSVAFQNITAQVQDLMVSATNFNFSEFWLLFFTGAALLVVFFLIIVAIGGSLE